MTHMSADASSASTSLTAFAVGARLARDACPATVASTSASTSRRSANKASCAWSVALKGSQPSRTRYVPLSVRRNDPPRLPRVAPPAQEFEVDGLRVDPPALVALAP